MQSLIGTNNEKEWFSEAKCKGKLDLFFPDEDDPESRKKVFQAKSICKSCPSRLECLTCAVVNIEKFGVWGGLTARQVSRLRNQVGITNEANIRRYIQEKVINV